MSASIVLCAAGRTYQLDLANPGASLWVTSDVPVCRWSIVSTISQPVIININADTTVDVQPARPSQSGQNAPGVMINTNDAVVVQLPTTQNINTELGGYTSNVQIIATSGATSGQVYITPVL